MMKLDVGNHTGSLTATRGYLASLDDPPKRASSLPRPATAALDHMFVEVGCRVSRR